MLGYFGGFWDDWNLLHKVTFDGENRLIIIADEVTDISVRTDIYSDWKEWLRIRDYAKFPRAVRSIGGDPTKPGQQAGDQYFLMNGWRIRTWEGDHTLNVDGALFVDATADTGFTQLGRATGSINVPTLKPQGVTIATTVSNLVTTVQVDPGGMSAADRTVLDNTSNLITSMSAVINNMPDTGSFSTMQTGINQILGSTRIFSVGITGGDVLSASTVLTEPDGFYDGMGVILTSGSTGTTRMINSYTQAAGTIFFEEALPFAPVSGSDAVIIAAHNPVKGSTG